MKNNYHNYQLSYKHVNIRSYGAFLVGFVQRPSVCFFLRQWNIIFVPVHESKMTYVFKIFKWMS